MQAGLEAVADHPDVRFAGYLQDAQKEYAEANVTRAPRAATELPDARRARRRGRART